MKEKMRNKKGEMFRIGPGVMISVLMFLFVFVVFMGNFRYLNSGDAVPNELLPISFIEEGDFDFDEFLDEYDEIPYYFPIVKGRAVSFYPIMPGLLNIPAFIAGKQIGLDIKRFRYNFLR